MTASHRAQSKFRPDIEGLRGIAVLLVVLFHCGVPGFGGGFIGVDVFFALSGYLITGLIVDEIELTGKLSFRNFYARRVRRLLPASGLVVVTTLVAALWIYSPLEIVGFAKSALFTSLYVSNYMFMHDATNYFASDVATNPYLHTWSLAVEEQFYLFWPALIALAFVLRGTRRRLAAIFLVMFLASLALCIWLTHSRQPWAFFSLPTRAWEFSLGGLASLVRRPQLESRASSMRALGWVGLLAILVAGCFYSSTTSFPGYAAVLPIAGTVAALLAGASGVPSKLQTLLGSRVLQYLGRLSYSWYLWHWPVVLFSVACFPDLTWRGRLVAGAVALLLAQITYLVLEMPVRFNPYLLAHPTLSLSLALIVPLSGLAASKLVARDAYHTMASGDQQRFWQAANDSRKLFDSKCLTVAQESRLSQCEFGDRQSGTIILLFGDSHAEHWFPAVETIANEKHWRLITLLKSSCPAARVDVFTMRLKRWDTECSAWRERALQRIVQLSPKIVILAEADGVVATHDVPPTPAQVTAGRYEEGLRSTLSDLNAHGLKTLVIADVPRPKSDVPVCLSRLAARVLATHDCLMQRDRSLNQDARQAEVEAVQNLNGVRLADFVDSFCDRSLCQPVISDHVVYRDGDHLTSTFAQMLRPLLERQIDSLAGLAKD